MTEQSQTMAGDAALMEALTVIDRNAGEIQHLKSLVGSLTADKEMLTKEVEELRKTSASNGGGSDQVAELLHINHQWDIEYKEQEEAFRRYRIDSQQAQQENLSYIAKLKEEKDFLSHEINTLKRELKKGDSNYELITLRKEISQYEKIIATLKKRLSEYEGHCGYHGDSQKIKQLEEEIVILKQQVSAYKDDFEAERRDRERLVEDKNSVALRYEAEVTALKLQLDRSRNELTHYTTEATRLAQQLRLRNQYDEDQYKRHLESRGYVSRGTLPPLDPYVEHDPPTSHTPSPSHTPQPAPRRNSPPNHYGNHLLARSSNELDPHSAPASMETTANDVAKNSTATKNSSNGASRYPDATYPAYPRNQQQPPNSVLQNVGAYVPGRVEIDGDMSPVTKNSPAVTINRPLNDVMKVPPLQTKGRHKCPRCARRFQTSAECNDHKTRCIS